MAWQYWWASSRWAMLLFLILLLCMDTFGFRVLTHSSHLRSLREKVDDRQNDNSKSFPSPDESFQFNTSVLEKYSIMKGLVLRPTVTGVYLKLEAYPIGGSRPIGYLNAFLRPLPPGIFHLDTIQVKNRRQNLGYTRESWSPEGSLISFIMGSWALCWARERGCHTAELMAIKDSEEMHAILVKLYSSFGFRSIREVGDDIGSITDRLVWGGVGTLMSLDINNFFMEWTPRFQAMVTREGERRRDSFAALTPKEGT